MELPVCCGKGMKLRMETTKFLEVGCERCGDTVYLKKTGVLRPQMIDD